MLRFLVSFLIILETTLISCDAQNEAITMITSPVLVRGSFRQEGANCTSVAVTKWIIATYGVAPLSGPFSVKAAGTTLNVLLADNSNTSVSKVELGLAAAQSGFDDKNIPSIDLTADARLRKAIIEKGNLIYAVQAKRLISEEKQKGYNSFSFDEALDRLGTSNEEVDDVFKRLGFTLISKEKLIVPTSGFVFGSEVKPGGVAHVAFGYEAPNSSVYDEYGTPIPLSEFGLKHTKPVLVWRYALIQSPVGTPVTVGLQCAKPEKHGNYDWKSCG